MARMSHNGSKGDSLGKRRRQGTQGEAVADGAQSKESNTQRSILFLCVSDDRAAVVLPWPYHRGTARGVWPPVSTHEGARSRANYWDKGRGEVGM